MKQKLTLVIKLVIILCSFRAYGLGEDLPLEKERLMGTLFMQQLYGGDAVVTDPCINDYLQHLGHRLGQSSGIKDYKLHFFGVNSDELNAFAFFGGHVAVHTGLIQQVRNESELAAVLAHETAHVAQKHLPRMMAQNQKLMPLTIAQLLAATAIGVLGGGEAGAHLATAVMANHIQQMINYTHTHEQEADRIGMQILSRAQFSPQAMATVFERLQKKSIYQDKAYAYLQTHPLFESRIADAQNRAATLPYQQAPDSLAFHLVRARLELLKNETQDECTKRLKAQLTSGKYANETAAQYAYALALARQHKFTEALQHFRMLSNEMPHHWMIDLSLAETEYASGNRNAARASLKHWLQVYPNHPPMVFCYCTMLLELNNQQSAQEAQILLLNVLIAQKNYPANPQFYELLARTQSQNKNYVGCHQSQAEWHAARGEYPKALAQLNYALEKVQHSPQLLKVIKQRKQALTEQFELQKSL
jgi:predicted Zn-dependent protease